MNHILPETCPACGEVVRNDMAVKVDRVTRQRLSGHVQFACNYEVEVGTPTDPNLIGIKIVYNECRKGKIWPNRT